MSDIVEQIKVQLEQNQQNIESGWLLIAECTRVQQEQFIRTQKLYSDLGMPYHLSEKQMDSLKASNAASDDSQGDQDLEECDWEFGNFDFPLKDLKDLKDLKEDDFIFSDFDQTSPVHSDLGMPYHLSEKQMDSLEASNAAYDDSQGDQDLEECNWEFGNFDIFSSFDQTSPVHCLKTFKECDDSDVRLFIDSQEDQDINDSSCKSIQTISSNARVANGLKYKSSNCFEDNGYVESESDKVGGPAIFISATFTVSELKSESESETETETETKTETEAARETQARQNITGSLVLIHSSPSPPQTPTYPVQTRIPSDVTVRLRRVDLPQLPVGEMTWDVCCDMSLVIIPSINESINQSWFFPWPYCLVHVAYVHALILLVSLVQPGR